MWVGEIGGLEKYVLQLSTALKEHEYDVEICVLFKGGPVSYEARRRGIKVHIIGLRNGFDLVRAFRFFKLIRVGGIYDVFHVHDRNFLANLMLSIICKGKKVFTEHGGELISGRSQKRFFFYKLLAFQYSKIIANSEYIKKVLVGRGLVFSEKVLVVHNGIESEKAPDSSKETIKRNLKIAADKKVIGVIARMVPAKGVDLFIDVAKKIAQTKNNFVFLVVGGGPMKQEYEKLAARDSGIADIRFLGWRTDIGDILSVLDAYMFTSRWEPFGISLVEAMMAGVPIAGFNIPGANEILVKDETSLLVEPFDTNMLSEKVILLTRDELLRSKFINNGRRLSNDRYSIKRNSERIIEIYKDL